MKNLLLQSRAVSLTVKNPLIGAWIEYYFFYVKFSDMDFDHGSGQHIGDALKDMIITPDRVMTDIDATAADELTYIKAVTTPGGSATQINYVFHCLRAVLESYFRDADEVYNTSGSVISNGVSNEYLTHLKPGKDFTDSLLQDTEFTSKDVDVDIDGDATITAQEVMFAMEKWQMLRQGNLTDMTFEDYLRAQGVNAGLAQAEEHKPELIRVIRDYSYPVNTVDPTDGDPSTAFSWSIAESANKDRFFSEPGFLFGATVFRPKIYMSGQTANMSSFLNRVQDWLPNAITQGHGEGTWKKFNGTATNTPNESDGPFDTIADDYWIDVKDLYLHGEQFVNFTLSDSDAGLIAIPTTTGARKYTTKAELDTLFDGASCVDAMKQDGVVRLNILGQNVDTSPTTGQEDD